MYALIRDGAVARLYDVEVDPSPQHHPSQVFILVPPEWENLIDERCRWTGTEFLPPFRINKADGSPILDEATGDPLTDMDWFVARAMAGVRAVALDARQKATGGADLIEIASWPAKEMMARRQEAGAPFADDAAALQAEADLRGTTLVDLVTVILAKAAAFKLAAGLIQGWQKQSETLVATEAANGDVAAIVSGLAALKSQAAVELEALLADL